MFTAPDAHMHTVHTSLNYTCTFKHRKRKKEEKKGASLSSSPHWLVALLPPTPASPSLPQGGLHIAPLGRAWSRLVDFLVQAMTARAASLPLGACDVRSALSRLIASGTVGVLILEHAPHPLLPPLPASLTRPEKIQRCLPWPRLQ